MIKASALLAAGAIGLLVAGVLASSLLMVYVSIAVCAVAALILAAGILTHWAEIFGRAQPQSASVPESWSASQAQVRTPVLASAQATATSGHAERRSRREDAGGRPAAPPEVAGPQAGLPVPGGGDDLWDRVEEELGSVGKRDTGALSWPGIELPALADPPATAGPAEKAGPQGPPPAGTKAWTWGQGPGWQPSETPGPSWPPPAAAFAGAPAPPDAKPAAEEPPGPVPEATAAEPAPDDEGAGPHSPGDGSAGPDSPGDDSAGAAPGDEATGPAAEDEDQQADARPGRPQWIISLPGRESPAADQSRPPDEAGTGDPAAAGADAAAVEPEAGEPAAEEPEAGEPAAEEPEAGEPAAEEPEAGEPAAEEPEAGEPAAEEPEAGEPPAEEPATVKPAAGEAAAPEPAAQEPAAEEPESGGPASESGPGRIEVTVVPGVARYHRSECILIRFLGAGDLEIMTRQEAEEATFVPCRACQPDQLEG